MAAKLTRVTHKIAIQLYLVAESCTTCSSRSKRPVRKLLDTPSYSLFLHLFPQSKSHEHARKRPEHGMTWRGISMCFSLEGCASIPCREHIITWTAQFDITSTVTKEARMSFSLFRYGHHRNGDAFHVAALTEENLPCTRTSDNICATGLRTTKRLLQEASYLSAPTDHNCRTHT
jgi:hypothetical protein